MGLRTLTRTAAPTVEPVTLGEIKTHLRLTGTEDDYLLPQLVKAARDYVETFTRRAICTQTW